MHHNLGYLRIFESTARRERQFEEAKREYVDRIMQEEPQKHYPIITDEKDLRKR